MTTVLDAHPSPLDESGTVEGDRRFRPDIQGLRAVAIALVVLYHADIPGISGGYVGVDVFFVISGFVITGVLVREREKVRRTSFPNFYGRRARRIIPAASLVIVVTVIAAFHYLGPLTGHDTAIDGQWAAVFLANFHFAASQTNYLASQRPPSALQNYWSLAVEEQFYVVYPALLVLCASVGRRFSLRMRLGAVLVVVIVASFTYSVVLTSSNAPAAFFSPLTRAWELALGALLAVSSGPLRRLPGALAALAGWVGLGAIVLAATTLTSASVYPGALVALPVLGTGLVIAAGAAQPRWGAERLLGLAPFQWLGLISYSLYLWHWPLLIIAAQERGATTLPVADNIVIIVCAVVLSVLTYVLVENPIRHATRLRARRWASVLLGLCLIGATLVVTTLEQRRPTVNLGALDTASSGAFCKNPASGVVAHLRATYAPGHPSPPPSALAPVLVVGDSTACTLLPGLQAVGPSYGMAFFSGAVIGCGVVSGTIAPLYAANGFNYYGQSSECQGQANAAESAGIEKYHPGLIVWASTEEHRSVQVTSGGKKTVVTAGTPQWKSLMRERIEVRVKKFLATGANVILVLEPPSVHAGDQETPDDVAFEDMNALLREVAAEHPTRVDTVDLQTRVCPSGPPCPFVVDGFGAGNTPADYAKAIRPDAIHYLPAGALWAARWMVPQIAAKAKTLS
jgi:peptidoglycan/LPS O-acetylase OafA/YrhL